MGRQKRQAAAPGGRGTSMYRRDYILRLIERFGRMLIALRNHIVQRDIDSADAEAQIQEVAREAGLDFQIARSLDPSALLMWLAPTDEIDAPRLWLTAELLYLEALDARASGAEGAGRADFERALALFSHLPPDWKPSDDFGTAGERAGEIRASYLP
jgi:hypothetical protein